MAFDQQRADAFAERLLGDLNAGALCLMTSIGHRTGLFDTMAALGPATPAAIAEAASLNERYVREWLGAMLTGGIVESPAESGQYALPAEHAALLTRAAPEGNVAVFAQYIGVLGSVENDVVDCFRHGGGVPYAKYPRFHEVMAEDSGQTVLSSLDSHILPLVPGLEERLAAGIDVLDVGCGSGLAAMHLAQRFPASRFTGLDLSEEAIRNAQAETARRNLPNLRFQQRDLTSFDAEAEPAAYDFITTFDAVHDQAQPRAVLRGIHRALRPGGVYLMQDIRASSSHAGDADHPVGPLMYTVSCMHCMTVSLAQGGEGLGAMWGERQARELLAEAGFGAVETHTLAHDFQNNYYVMRKPAA